MVFFYMSRERITRFFSCHKKCIHAFRPEKFSRINTRYPESFRFLGLCPTQASLNPNNDISPPKSEHLSQKVIIHSKNCHLGTFVVTSTRVPGPESPAPCWDKIPTMAIASRHVIHKEECCIRSIKKRYTA